jgi:sterol desaturase/sphingolipid hydroxylase (fatty acid hydroxylase superfamily)
VVALGIIVLLLIIGESLSPLKSRGSDRLLHVLKNSVIFALARTVFFLVSLLALERYSFYSLKPLLGAWFIVYVFIVSDLSVYWWHRLNHRIPFLWRFHQVHHSDQFLDFSTALRFHFGELTLSYLVRSSFYLLLGFEMKEVLLYNLVLTGANLFHHSNIALPEKLESFLAKILVTPKFHRTHHSLYLSHTDSNYSALWVGWDVLFGSYSGLKETEQVGVPYAQGLSLQSDLLLPFQSIKTWPANYKGAP